MHKRAIKFKLWVSKWTEKLQVKIACKNTTQYSPTFYKSFDTALFQIYFIQNPHF